MSVGRAALVALVVVAGACARQEYPSGGPEDSRPPMVIETSPEPFGTLTDLRGGVIFRFNERISEQVPGGTLQSAFTLSPRGGALEVDHGGRSLTVRPAGGFRPGMVYRLTLQAVVSDLFGNRVNDPFELVFTTGDVEPVPTTLAGEAWDRITGRPAGEAQVVAVGGDGVVHQSTTDREGIFAFRYLPGGVFRVTAFDDVNRNGEVDSTEAQGAATAELAIGDTLLLDLAVLEPDTSAAVLIGVEAPDTVTVALTFDDHLDPDMDASGVDASISADEVSAPTIERIMQEAEYAEWVATVADSLARLDSIDEARRVGGADTAVGDTAGADTTVAPPDVVVADTTAAPPDTAVIGQAGEPGRRGPPELEPLEGSQPGPTRDGRRVLPGRRIVLLLSEPLEYGVEYHVRAAGVVNINGLPGGGGVDTLVVEVPPDTAAADSAAVPDTGTVSGGRTAPDAGRVVDVVDPSRGREAPRPGAARRPSGTPRARTPPRREPPR